MPRLEEFRILLSGAVAFCTLPYDLGVLGNTSAGIRSGKRGRALQGDRGAASPGYYGGRVWYELVIFHFGLEMRRYRQDPEIIFKGLLRPGLFAVASSRFDDMM